MREHDPHNANNRNEEHPTTFRSWIPLITTFTRYLTIFHMKTTPDRLDIHQKNSEKQPNTFMYAPLIILCACSTEKRLCMARAFEAGDKPHAIRVMEDIMAVLLSPNLR